MNYKKMRKGLLLCVMLLMICWTKSTLMSFFLVKNYRFIKTKYLSENYCASITMHAQQLLDAQHNAYDLIANIKKEFPIVDKITIAYRPDNIYVTMHAHEPICYINDNLVLTAHNELFPKDYFSEQALDSCIHMTVAQEIISQVPSLVPPLLRELPDFNQKYNLVLSHKHHAQLIDKEEDRFSIILSAMQKNMSFLLTHYDAVKKNILERKGLKKEERWIMDIRFVDYIVAYKV